MPKKVNKSAAIRRYITKNPQLTIAQVAKELSVSYQYVWTTKRAMEKKLENLAYVIGKGRNQERMKEWEITHVSTSDNSIEKVMEKEMPVTMEEPKSDPVNHPAHYKVGGIETIDFIEAKKLNYNLGNVVKYITRADHKGERLENLEKAMWYLKRELGLDLI